MTININKIYIQPIKKKQDNQSPPEYLYYGISSENLPTDLLTNSYYHHTHNKKNPSLLLATTQKISITITTTFSLIAIVFILIAGLYFALPLTSLWIIIPIVLLSISLIVLFSLLILGPISTTQYCQFEKKVTEYLFKNANKLLPFESVYPIKKEQEEYKIFENDQWKVAQNNLILLPTKEKSSTEDIDFFKRHTEKQELMKLKEKLTQDIQDKMTEKASCEAEIATFKTKTNPLGREGIVLKKAFEIEKHARQEYKKRVAPDYFTLWNLVRENDDPKNPTDIKTKFRKHRKAIYSISSHNEQKYLENIDLFLKLELEFLGENMLNWYQEKYPNNLNSLPQFKKYISNRQKIKLKTLEVSHLYDTNINYLIQTMYYDHNHLLNSIPKRFTTIIDDPMLNLPLTDKNHATFNSLFKENISQSEKDDFFKQLKNLQEEIRRHIEKKHIATVIIKELQMENTKILTSLKGNISTWEQNYPSLCTFSEKDKHHQDLIKFLCSQKKGHIQQIILELTYIADDMYTYRKNMTKEKKEENTSIVLRKWNELDDQLKKQDEKNYTTEIFDKRLQALLAKLDQLTKELNTLLDNNIIKE